MCIRDSVAEAALREMGAEVEAAKMANELVRAAEDRAHRAEDRAIAAESRAAAAEARAVRAEADAERAAAEVRAARREVGSRPKLDTDAVRGLVRAAEERAADAEERAAAADASVASARSALLESDDRVARLEARLARCRAGAVERAGREGRRDFNLVGRTKATAVNVPRGMRKRLRKERTRKSAVGPSDGTRSSARSTQRGGDCASCS